MQVNTPLLLFEAFTCLKQPQPLSTRQSHGHENERNDEQYLQVVKLASRKNTLLWPKDSSKYKMNANREYQILYETECCSRM